MRNRALVVILVLALGIFSCGQPAETWQVRGWTVTPSPTNSLVVPTQTPLVVVITATSIPTTALGALCVTASEAVYLRPSPNATYYPLTPIPNGTKVIDTGTRDGNWIFVQYENRKGWINSNFLGDCGG